MDSTTRETLFSMLAADSAIEPAGSSPRRWFYTQAGEFHGPVTGPELRAAAQLGFLGRWDSVRCGADGSWLRAGTIPGLFGGGT